MLGPDELVVRGEGSLDVVSTNQCHHAYILAVRDVHGVISANAKVGCSLCRVREIGSGSS